VLRDVVVFTSLLDVIFDVVIVAARLVRPITVDVVVIIDIVDSLPEVLVDMIFVNVVILDVTSNYSAIVVEGHDFIREKAPHDAVIVDDIVFVDIVIDVRRSVLTTSIDAVIVINMLIGVVVTIAISSSSPDVYVGFVDTFGCNV